MMISYGTGMIMIGGTWSTTVEYFNQGVSTLLDGKTPKLDSSCAALTDRESIIITGGKGGETNRVQAWEFSLQTGIWTKLPDIPGGGRYEHSCAFLSQVSRKIKRFGKLYNLNLGWQKGIVGCWRQHWDSSSVFNLIL